MPLGCLGVIFLLAAFVGGILLLVEISFQKSDVYRTAMERAQANPEVMQKIGKPLKAGWLSSGKINISGSSGDADISIPISGPRGKGTLYAVAKKSAGEWHYQTLQVEVEGESQRIDLLQKEPEDMPVQP